MALEHLSVLLVEDDLITREEVAIRLGKKMGERISELFLARDGREGLELFKRHTPDMVISDIRMPHMDGLEMVRRIREEGCDGQDCHVIIASAHSDEDTLLSTIDTGVDKFIKKPINHNELLQALEAGAARLRSHTRKQDKNELLGKVLDNNPELFLTTDGQEVYYLNKAFKNFLQIGSPAGADVIGMIGALLGPLPDELTQKEQQNSDNWLELVQQGDMKALTVTITPPGGCRASSNRTFLLRTNIVTEQGREYTIVSFSDVTHLEKEKDFYLELALKDPLTGAYNRKKFFEELEKEAFRATRYGKHLSLMMLDIDDFKQVNDTHGHQIGDKVLVELTTLLQDHIRFVDLLARYGGEEFFILTPETHSKGCLQSGEKLRQIIEEHTMAHGISITCSFGLAEYVDGEPLESFIRRVDNALYKAKSKGKNQICIAD